MKLVHLMVRFYPHRVAVDCHAKLIFRAASHNATALRLIIELRFSNIICFNFERILSIFIDKQLYNINLHFLAYISLETIVICI